jgi:hypothetical protein
MSRQQPFEVSATEYRLNILERIETPVAIHSLSTARFQLVLALHRYRRLAAPGAALALPVAPPGFTIIWIIWSGEEYRLYGTRLRVRHGNFYSFHRALVALGQYMPEFND